MGLSKYIFTLLEDRPNLFYSERVPLHRHTSHYSQNLKLSMYFILMLFTITKQKTFQKTVNAARPAGFSATVLHWIGIHSRVNVPAAPLTKVKQRGTSSPVYLSGCVYLESRGVLRLVFSPNPLLSGSVQL